MSNRYRWPIRTWVSLVLAAPLVVSPAQGQVAPASTSAPMVFSLERAIDVGLGNSYDVEAAELGVRVADQQVREAWSAVYPELTATASYGRNLLVQQGFLPAVFFDPDAGPEEVVPVRFGSDNSWNAGFNFSQPLFEADVLIGVGAANRFRTLEAERMRGTTQNVVTAIRQSYLATLLSQEEYRLIQNSVERTRKTLDETRGLNRAGLASSYDVLRLEVQLANLEPNLRRAENLLAERKRDLLIEMGLDPGTSIDVQGSLAEIDIAPRAVNTEENAALIEAVGYPVPEVVPIDDLTQTASEWRTDLRQQRLNIDLENARLSSQKAEYYPTLSLFLNYNVTAQTNGQWFADFFGSVNSRTKFAATGVSIQFPIFRGFSRDARIQQTKATLGQLDAQLQRSRLQVHNELQTVVSALEEARLRVQTQGRAVGQAQRGFEIASAEYREGLGSQLQITDAENALRQSEFNYAQAVYDYLMARSQLDAAAGTVPVAAGEVRVRRSDSEDQ
jgi:outer membrane protein